MAEGGADAVPGVRQHHPKGDALCSHSVEFFQGHVTLGSVGLTFSRDAGMVAPCRVIRPASGQEQPHSRTSDHVPVGQRQRDQRLAVGERSERTTGLAGDADAVLTTLEQRGVEGGQDALISSAQ